ncbi:MFS general substrate transporter-27 [Coleophoma cylindrospora]|uniref:MFS general substrate transporter-27 n=1 Tax=Coleophoma cylindrospora TaxID=1849047 RepID=A0A3D8SPC3_9HELO|nr:MFS general substrate transporter-27 [Coleophoma cylindrospora]
MGIMARFRETPLIKEMTGPLLLVSIFSSLGGMSFGIDNAYWGGLLGMTKFCEDFGRLDPVTGTYVIPTTWQSVGSGTPTAGVAIGCLLSAPLSKRLGRKPCFILLACVAIVGILIQATAQHSYWQILVGRIINSLSMGIICNVVPLYQTECAPPAIRGAAINFYQFWQLFGALLSTIINYACQHRTDQWAYRTIIVVQFIIPAILFAGAFFLPDSPRWLLIQGRQEEATEVMLWLRKKTPKDLVVEEMRLIEISIEEQRTQHYAASYIDCFRGSNRRRTLIAIGVQAFQQLQGASFILNYIYVFLESIGVSNTYAIGMYLYLVNLASAGAAFYIADKFGRRNLMGFGALIQTAMMLTVGGLAGVDGAKTKMQQNGALAALFIWLAIQAFAWGSCVWITTAEVGTLQLREKTITLATFFGFGFGLLITYVNPYMQNAGYGNLQGKVGFVYGGFSFISLLFVIFYLPELKGRSLEELDELFQRKISVWRFGTTATEGVGAEIRAIDDQVGEMDGKMIIDGVVVASPKGDQTSVDVKEKEASAV